MALLSVNVNKVATLRNARGGRTPDLLQAVGVCLDAGVKGITVHPRADERHITRADVFELAEYLSPKRETIEFNIEGDPRPDFIDLVTQTKPHQCTLVPVRPGEVTSEAGWVPGKDEAELLRVIPIVKAAGCRVSIFVEADSDAIDLAHTVGADRVELYTEPFARAFERGEADARASFEAYVGAAQYAKSRGLGINAGHDLDVHNLVMFRDLPGLAEVSIGHALISQALFDGLDPVVREYLQVLATGAQARQ